MNIETTVVLNKNTAKERKIVKRLLRIQESTALQLKLEALRATIEKEVQPKLLQQRQLEDVLDNIARPRPVSFSNFVSKPKLAGYEYTPEWWREAELRERQEEIRLRTLAKESEIQRQKDLAGITITMVPSTQQVSI